MLLSSVNLIKNGNRRSCYSPNSNNQFCDFIIGKIKEEQDRKEKKVLGQAPYSAKHKTKQQEVEVFKWDIPVSNPAVTKDSDSTSSTTSKKSNEEVSHVSIETSDGYFITADLDRNVIYLEEADFPSTSGHFKQNTYRIDTDDAAKRQHLAVFQLTTDKSMFVTTTQDQQLQVTKCDVLPNPEEPDDRFFVLHLLNNGNMLLQPYQHKGYYIHHIDNCLFVRRLEINWRPPEEYFFKIAVVDLPEPDVLIEEPGCKEVKLQRPYHRNQKKLISNQKAAPQKMSLFFGCFGMKSRKMASSKKQKVHR